MNYKLKFKQMWSAVAVVSLGLMIFRFAGYDSNNLQYLSLALNSLMFILSLPCSIFAAPVIISAAHFLEMNPFGADGIYLNTVLFLLLGFLQWFWIADFWSPNEPVMQKLNLADAK